MVAPMLLSAIGYFTADFIDSLTSLSIPWWLLSIIYAALIWFINSRGIAESARAALIFLVIEVGVLFGLFVTVLGRGGDAGLSLSSFNPGAGGVGISGLSVGMLWGILYFVGFESAATLGEEARNPSRTIPRALFTGVIVLGLFYIFACYAIVNGFGPAHIGRLQADATPLVTLGKRYWGISWIVSLTILASQFANVVAGSNAAVRIMFSLGRARILPRRLGATDERGIPQVALWTYMAFSLAVTLIVGAIIGPLGVYGLAGTILGIVMVIVYILMNFGVTRFYLRQHRDEFSIWKHGIIPGIASLVMLLPLYGQLVPLPPMPNLIAPCLIGAWIIGAIVYVVVLRRNSPERIALVIPSEVADPPVEAAPPASARAQ
jgi:amino acid transporter